MISCVKCPVCGGDPGDESDGYMDCLRCKHQWKNSVVRSEIVNEVLDVRKMLKSDSLTRAKVGAVSKFSRRRESLLDFGAGSGKFLFFESKSFRSVQGVEITPECIEFARNSLRVSLSAAVPWGKKFDVVTAWHSLEHIPPHQLLSTVKELQSIVDETFILSVPNANSWLYRIFGRDYAFFDESSHYHQFTPHSMRTLLKQAGWKSVSPFQIYVYSIFCYAQTLTNVLTKTHNALYYALRRGELGAIRSKLSAALHAALFALSLPFAVLLTALERVNLDRAACLNVVCRKDAEA